MYPNTTRFIRILAADNAGLDTTDQLKGMDDWVWPDNIELVEQQLKGLTRKEMEAVASEVGAERVYRKHRIPDVREFVEEFFDGALYHSFYNPPADGEPSPRRYPRLVMMLRMLATDNGMKLLPSRRRVWPNNADELERTARVMDLEDLETLAIGEHESQKALIVKYDLAALDEFLTEAFDGKLRGNFFE